LETPPDASLVKFLETTSKTTAGTVAYGTEGPFFHSLGIETVIFGPGSIDQAHQPNEFLAQDQIEPGIAAIGSLIEHYCI
jgi:acetylornithine deacetylase